MTNVQQSPKKISAIRRQAALARWGRIPPEQRREMVKHLIPLRKLAADAPLWCLLVREAVKAAFGGNHVTAAAACRRFPEDQPLSRGTLQEITRGVKGVYVIVSARRVRQLQPPLYPSRMTIDRLCAGLRLDRSQLLAILDASGGGILEDRRSEIAAKMGKQPRSKKTRQKISASKRGTASI